MSDHLGRLEVWVNKYALGVDSHPETFQWVGDVKDVVAECRQLRKDVAALEGVLSDVREDGPFAAGEAHGAARQLAECVAYLEGEFLPTSSHRGVVNGCRALGPVRPPLPAERLAAENAEMRELLKVVASGECIHETYFRARQLLGLPAADPVPTEAGG